MADDAVARVARVFDTVADDYDQSGVAFFAPIAAQLVELLDVHGGERVLDVGCGRGAVTLRAAEATGPTGSVTALDVSPAMVEHTRAAVRAGLDAGLGDRLDNGLATVHVEVADATALAAPDEPYDVLASSLVLFFLPEPAHALPGWLRQLRPGGRAGITTFGRQDELWAEVDALFAAYLPASLLDPRTRGSSSPFATDQGVAGLLTGAGFVDVRTVHQPLPVVFEDAEHWRAWTMSTGQRMFWGFVPAEERAGLFERAAVLLERARDGDRIVLHQDVRHTLAHR